MKHLLFRLRVTITAVARSLENFNRGSSPIFSGNLDLVGINSQPFERVRAPDQVLYVALIILHIQELVRWFDSCEGPRINSARVKFTIYCATYSMTYRIGPP